MKSGQISRRCISSLAVPSTRPVCARVPNRALIEVSGRDTGKLLNGIVTSTVPWPPANNGFYSSFLHAQGRIQYDVFLWPMPPSTFSGSAEPTGYLIEYDPRPSEAPPLLSLLKRYILRSKVTAKDASNRYDVWAAWGGETSTEAFERQWRFGNRGAVEPVWESHEAWRGAGSVPTSLRDLRAVGMGLRMLVRKGDPPQLASNHDIVEEEEYTLHRIVHGVPEGIVDLPPMQAIAMNSNFDMMGGIDFRKGCYIGQELTVRTYHTGVIRRRIFPVQIFPLGTSPRTPPSPEPSLPALPPSDISLPTTSSRRGTPNRLLTSTRGVGLASLHTRHVHAVDQGEVEMSVEDKEVGVMYGLKHWVPEWWPVKTFDDEGP